MIPEASHATAPEADQAIRDLVTRLSRPSRSGEAVIESAAIRAAGADSQAIIRWILAQGGEPEASAPQSPTRGLHGGRLSGGPESASPPPSRYVLPAGALS